MTEEVVATKIVKKLQDEGFTALFAGGCVRDMSMDRVYSDIDIATSATPDQVEGLFKKTFPIGKSFGVIIVVIEGVMFEVAAFRVDSNTSDGRRPDSVEFTDDYARDMERRDFTINAMFYDPIKKRFYDFHGGREDIEAELIRFVGDPASRIKEDKLRMLRAVRFATTLGFDIHPETSRAIQMYSSKIVEVSSERIKAELDKILLSEHPSEGIRELLRVDLLRFILPEIALLSSIPQSKKWHAEGSVFNHTMLALDCARKRTDNLDVLWSVLLHDTGKIDCYDPIAQDLKSKGHEVYSAIHAEAIMDGLKVSSDHKNTVVAIVADHMRIKVADQMKKSKLKRLMSENHFDKLVCAALADSEGSLTTDEEALRNKYDWLTRIEAMRKELKNVIVLPVCLVSGRDLIEIGLTPGPKFTEILTTIMDYQLDGSITTKEQALEMIQKGVSDGV